MIRFIRVCACRRTNAVTSNNNAITNPATFITPRVRVTIEPAISLAFGKANDRNTPNAAGATTAPKNNATPNQAANKANRVRLRIVPPVVLALRSLVLDLRSQIKKQNDQKPKAKDL